MAVLIIALIPLPESGRLIHEAQSSLSTSHNIRIEASQYAYSPAEIRVAQGDTVTIELISTDVVHGIYLDGYDLSVQADPGQSAVLTFTAGKPGAFRFRCNVTCGAMHPFMIGRLSVGTNQWLYRSVGIMLLITIGVLSQGRTTKTPLHHQLFKPSH